MIRYSEDIEKIGLEVINEHPNEFERIINGDFQVAFLESDQEKTTNGNRVFGECSLVSKKYKWTCSYDFMITFYTKNCEYFTEEQLKILMWHELKHMGIDKNNPYIVSHDLNDFREIIDTYGVDWDKVI